MAATAVMRNWNAAQVVKQAKATSLVYAMGAAYELLEEIRSRITDPYPPASAPGESPHKRSGDLAGSFQVQKQGDRIAIVTSSPYAEALEKGTRRMEPRPFIRPALMALRGRFSKVVLR